MSGSATPSLVSIIMPCFNARKWVREAIESCFNQTYPIVEIVVVDDGSTDGSLEILNALVPRIKVAAGVHCGANNARNKGFGLSTGEYIQYLDADDYLLPNKIAEQVRFLEEKGADVVYGDYRYKRHLPDDSFSYLDKIIRTGEKDLLISLLSRGFPPLGAVLYRRHVVSQIGGWDEKLLVAQDRDFLTSAVLSGAKVYYQFGCGFIYRKHGPTTISSSDRNRWIENHSLFLQKAEAALSDKAMLTEERKGALAFGYFDLARAPYVFAARSPYRTYARCLSSLLSRIVTLYPNFKASDESVLFTVLQWLFGFRFAFHTVLRLRSAIAVGKSKLRNTWFHTLILRIRRTIVQRSERRDKQAEFIRRGRRTIERANRR